MRRVYQFLLVLFVSFMVLLVLYAAPPTRPWMEANLGPPLNAAFGGAWNGIKSSAPYKFLLANPLFIAIISVIIGICPVSFPIIHRSFNTVRGKFTKSAIDESSLYPKTTAPTHTVTQLTQKPEKTTTQPITPVKPTPEKETVKPEGEETA